MLQKSVVVTFLLFLFLLFSAGMVSAHTSDKVYTADRFDISAHVLPTNTLRVTETEVLHFSGDTFSFVKRELPTDNTDGINILSASMDHQSMSEGFSTGQYEEEDGNPITVTWHFLAQPETTHTFTLTYEVKGIVQKHPQQDLIDWKPLPDQHSYPIGSSTITITYPQSATLLQKPEVDRGTATVSTGPGGQVIYQASNLEADQSLELGLRFRPGLVSQEPSWQQDAEIQQQNAEISAKLWPFLLLAGLLITFLTAIVVPFFIIRHYRRYLRPSPSAAQLARLGVKTPPGDLPPALAGVLVKTDNGTPSWSQALATIFSLMARGVIAIAPPAQKRWRVEKTDFHLILRNRPPDLLPHEAVLVDILFPNQSGDVKPQESIEQAGKSYLQNERAFKEAVQGEMAAMGLIDRRRVAIRRRLGRASVLMFVLCALFCIVAYLIPWLHRLPWPFIFLPIGFVIGFFVVGIITASAALNISTYNEQSEQVVWRWKAFAEYMDHLTLRQGVLGAEDIATYLPYAAAFDLMETWIYTMEGYGMRALPPWFRKLMKAGNVTNQSQAFSEFHRMCHHAGSAGRVSSSSGSGSGSFSGGSSMSGSSGAAGGGSSSAG